MHKKLFVIRGNNNRLTNESELIEIFKNKGFEIFNPDKATYYEEVDAFSSASLIVSCAGAALTNLIYCNPSVVVYGIAPPEQQSFIIYRDFGINIQTLDADMEVKAKTLNERKFKLNPEKLQELFSNDYTI